MVAAVFGMFGVGCIPSGSSTVSSFGAGGVSPGLYRSLGKTADSGNCTWTQSILSFGTPFSFGGSADGPVYMELDGSPYLTVDGCITFWKVPSPWDRPLATPGQPFGNGDFLVGSEVAPGVYQAGATSGHCTWTRVRNFTGHLVLRSVPPGPPIEDEVIATGTASPGSTVTIEPSDFGFSSTGCGQWTKVG